MDLNCELPEKFAFLFEPKRYKILYGGRGGAKSWGIARALLVMGVSKPLRILCAREFQASIEQSVHKLLGDQIVDLKLTSFYEVQRTSIRGRNGTEFSFHGLKHNISSIKSAEGADIAWVEEAQNVSKSSWEVLIPTIRKEGSEIWVSFNPSLEADETYQRFVVNPPTNSIVAKVNWSDNPWFPKVLQEEKDSLRVRDGDAYLNVWEGHCRQSLDGAVYAQQLRQAQEENRITRVPHDPSKPVLTFWDLGRADKTAIWFAQQIGFEYRMIDYYENQGYALNHYLKELQSRAYNYGECYLPHDAKNELLASERTIAQQVEAFYKVQVVSKTSIADGIEAARAFFATCWFDNEKCADGLQCLRNYRYEIDEKTQQYSKNPLHDWASHGADAFRYAAMSMKVKAKPRSKQKTNHGNWMC